MAGKEFEKIFSPWVFCSSFFLLENSPLFEEFNFPLHYWLRNSSWECLWVGVIWAILLLLGSDFGDLILKRDLEWYGPFYPWLFLNLHLVLNLTEFVWNWLFFAILDFSILFVGASFLAGCFFLRDSTLQVAIFVCILVWLTLKFLFVLFAFLQGFFQSARILLGPKNCFLLLSIWN